MIKLEGYDTGDTFTFYSVQLMMDFISNELGENCLNTQSNTTRIETAIRGHKELSQFCV